MKLLKFTKHCFLFLLVLAMLSWLKAESGLSEVHGRISADNNPIFTMTVSYTENDGMGHNTVHYYDMAGQLRMEEKEVFHPQTLELIRFTLEDFKSGREEEFHKNKGQMVIRYKKDSQSHWKEKVQKLSRHLLHGSMVAIYIAQKIKDLEKGKKVSLKLLVPKYLTSYSFDLKKEEEVKVEGKKAYKIRMYPSSWFLRGVVKSTYFYVEAEAPHRLLKFEGLVTPKKDNGKSFTGVALFSY